MRIIAEHDFLVDGEPYLDISPLFKNDFNLIHFTTDPNLIDAGQEYIEMFWEEYIIDNYENLENGKRYKVIVDVTFIFSEDYYNEVDVEYSIEKLYFNELQCKIDKSENNDVFNLYRKTDQI